MNGIVQAILIVAGGIVTIDAALRVSTRVATGTVGRRQIAYSKLKRLAANTQVRFFEEILGTAAFRRTHPSGLTEHLWADPYFYVQALTDNDDRIVVYSVTSRRRRFRPPLPLPQGGLFSIDQEKPLGVRLNKTPFALGMFGRDPVVTAERGARRLWYSELYYFGNPGNYQTFALTISDSAPIESEIEGLITAFTEFRTLSPENTSEYLASAAALRFRRRASPNTYSVSAPHFDGAFLARNPGLLSPDLDTVRVFEQAVTPNRSAARRVRRSMRRMQKNFRGMSDRNGHN